MTWVKNVLAYHKGMWFQACRGESGCGDHGWTWHLIFPCFICRYLQFVLDVAGWLQSAVADRSAQHQACSDQREEGRRCSALDPQHHLRYRRNLLLSRKSWLSPMLLSSNTLFYICTSPHASGSCPVQPDFHCWPLYRLTIFILFFCVSLVWYQFAFYHQHSNDKEV